MSATAVNNVIIEHLQALRGSKDTSGPSKRRRQKLNVIPGKSVGVDGVDDSSSEDNDDESDEESEGELQNVDEEEETSEDEEGQESEEDRENQAPAKSAKYKIDDMVCVQYEKAYYPSKRG